MTIPLSTYHFCQSFAFTRLYIFFNIGISDLKKLVWIRNYLAHCQYTDSLTTNMWNGSSNIIYSQLSSPLWVTRLYNVGSYQIILQNIVCYWRGNNYLLKYQTEWPRIESTWIFYTNSLIFMIYLSKLDYYKAKTFFYIYLWAIMRLTSRVVQKFSYGKQKFFFIFGAPGVGKGTYARLLQKDLGLNHIASGE